MAFYFTEQKKKIFPKKVEIFCFSRKCTQTGSHNHSFKLSGALVQIKGC